MEIWKDIIGFEGVYQISSLGRVKSLARIGKKQTAILKPTIGKRGYFTIGLWRNQKIKLATIHRLIALHFIPNPKNKREVNHKDADKLNNSLENLEWVTPKENSTHAVKSEKVRKFIHKRGAYPSKYKNKVYWTSQIRIDYKNITLGNFTTKEGAQQAYYHKYLEHYGFAPWIEEKNANT